MTSHREEAFNSMSNTDRLLDYYQFSHDPFAARTPGFKFFTPKRKPVLAELHHLARYSNQLLVVTGPEGSGKTLLRQALVASSNKDAVQCVVLSAREFSAEDALLSYICQAVNAEGREVGSLLQKAQASEAVGIQLYLVVDDAQALELSALTMLAEIAEAGTHAPRVFLFGDDLQLQPLLAPLQSAGEGAVLHSVALQPLDLAETREYLGQRLEGAGQGIELLADEQIDLIHQRSQGWPGKINNIARQVMLDAMEYAPVAAAERASRGGFPLRTVAALALIAVGVGAAWYMGDKPQEPETTVLALPEPIPEVRLSGDQVVEPTPAPEAPLPAGPVSTGRTPDADTGAGIEEQELAPEIAATQGDAGDQPVPTKTAVATAEQPEAPPAAVAEPVKAEEPPAPAEKPLANPLPEPNTAKVGATAAAHQADWYRRQSADRYTVQLLGTRSEQAAIAFVAKHGEVKDIGYFETIHQGAPWFVVTQGSYGGRQAAQSGVAALPESLRNSKPWPRSFGDIQRSLR
ncbi:SPOR domain-containing protein [Halopseudomonas sp.]|uniref:SPOR domain-containing protein n=1 Tax=Halopseudomonas sp. TaxID=2901191 RepID=UPI003002D8F9